MILRVAAALAVLWAAVILLAYLHIVGKGPWASPAERHLRAMKDRVVAPAAVETLTIAQLAALPRDLPLAAYSAIEQRGVTVEGYVRRMKHAPDGDLHLDLAPDPSARAYVITEVTPQWRRGSERWSHDALVAAFRPIRGGARPWEQGPRRVRLSGWLLYDVPHQGRIFRDVQGTPASPAWEVHPVTRIELWDDSLRRFVDDPR